MSEIEKIYYEYVNTGIMIERKDVQQSRDALYNYLDQQGLSANEYENYVAGISCASEKQGFLSGFQHAMKIALECMGKTE